MTGEKEGVCLDCNDSGYAETYHGGIWTGENVRVSYSVCECECGESLREELAAALRALATQGGAE